MSNVDQRDMNANGTGDACDAQRCYAPITVQDRQRALAIALSRPELAATVNTGRYRALEFGTVCPTLGPTAPRRVKLSVYDYARRENRDIVTNLDSGAAESVVLTARQPLETPEEKADAFAIANADAAVQSRISATGSELDLTTFNVNTGRDGGLSGAEPQRAHRMHLRLAQRRRSRGVRRTVAIAAARSNDGHRPTLQPRRSRRRLRQRYLPARHGSSAPQRPASRRRRLGLAAGSSCPRGDGARLRSKRQDLERQTVGNPPQFAEDSVDESARDGGGRVPPPHEQGLEGRAVKLIGLLAKPAAISSRETWDHARVLDRFFVAGTVSQMSHGARAHELSDRRSLELHREVARRLRIDAGLLERARARVEDWSVSGAVHPDYVEEWRRLFEAGVGSVVEALEDPGELGQALRQVSPFAFVLPPRERWRLLRKVSGRSAP